MVSRIKDTKPAAAAQPPRNVIRPLYGVFIRDQVAKYRAEINVTISDSKQALSQGKPHKHAIPGDGVLEGSEYTKVKHSVEHLQKAVDALKPVFGEMGPPNAPTAGQARANVRGGPVGGPVAMYGVVLRHDLDRFRDSVNADLASIQAGLPTMSKEAQSEAKKAIRQLKAALTALKTAGSVWA
ncbi:MAG: hypothetical protein K1X89_01980 [Myxococcaceae bacterium]|nr:hypothetical protein [Myxococcaceae bacterium]